MEAVGTCTISGILNGHKHLAVVEVIDAGGEYVFYFQNTEAKIPLVAFSVNI